MVNWDDIKWSEADKAAYRLDQINEIKSIYRAYFGPKGKEWLYWLIKNSVTAKIERGPK